MTRETVRRFLGDTLESCLRIFDINLRQQYYDKEVIDQSLRDATVLKLNDDELPIVAELLGLRGKDTDGVAELFDLYRIELVVLTKGGEGSELIGRGARSVHPGFAPPQIADTVGAGDAFTATVAVGLLRGLSLDEINERANRVASYACTQHGATPQLPEELTNWGDEDDGPEGIPFP